MSKSAILLLITVLALSGLVMLGSVFAQLTPKPSVPEFTLKCIDNSYDVPPTTTTTIDQYTGKEIVTTTPGYHVENKSIEIIITNQPFTPYTDAEGNLINLYYNVRFKGHFGQEWDWEEPYNQPIRNGIMGTYTQNPQSSSEYTVISLPAGYPDDALVDFQVQTLEGYYTTWAPFTAVPIIAYRFSGESSDWSETQTIRIGESQTSSPEPTILTSTPFPTDYTGVRLSETEIIIGASIIVAIVIVGLGLLLRLIKRK